MTTIQSFTRRALLMLTVAASTLLATSATAAPVAKQNNQVPGYYRMMVGDFEVTALYDGYVDIGTQLLKGASADDIQSLLAKMFLESSKGVQTAVNAFLINTGKNLVLVDTGAAKCFGPALGNIQDNLKAAGYTPEQVDSVLLTHLHPDHACGLLSADGKSAYPNATIYIPKGDADYWLSSAEQAKAPEASRGRFAMSQKAVAPYAAADKVQTFNPDSKLLEGVAVVPSNGHTPGHTSYMFSSKGQDLLVWGDIVHSHSVQFSQPNVAIEFDSDSAKAIAARKKLFAEAAKDKLWVAGAHLPFPGIGHVRKEGEAYAWVPTEFGPIRSDR
ncbi:MBL fold metallo-hydrolase [Pseudomonas sp. RL_15y_Pfl2_60]|uniref:MBL fold metallo-hydrolase n=1 Tax=Pseudomonas sp. RL_15y_Pfl2_60 TaxID=3088709 RepID=UPI0030DA6B6D